MLQSTHKFFSEQQQQQLKGPVGKPGDSCAPNHQGGAAERPDTDKPPMSGAKPVRTGPIKPQSIKPEEGK